MGREQYLVREALGRSAFEDGLAELPPYLGAHLTHLKSTDPPGTVEIRPSGHSPFQGYDYKGRPINISTPSKNSAQRKAQNEILELFGVVERADGDDPRHALNARTAKYDEVGMERRVVLVMEDSFGEKVEEYLAYVKKVLLWWPEVLIVRAEAGLDLAGTAGFAAVVAAQLVRAAGGNSGDQVSGSFGGKLKAILSTLFAGLPASVLFTVAQILWERSLSRARNRLQKLIIRRTPSNRAARRLNEWALWACEALTLTSDVILLPLLVHSTAQQLGLAPVWPLFPHWRTFLPWHSASVLRLPSLFRWRFPLMRFIFTPADLMFARSYMKPLEIEGGRWVESIGEGGDEDEVDWVLPFKSNEAPPMPDFWSEPLERVKWEVQEMCWAIARRMGWNLRGSGFDSDFPLETCHVLTDDMAARLELGHGVPEGELRIRTHRFTTLSRLPVETLHSLLDTLFRRLLTLPLDFLAYRSILASYPGSLCARITSRPSLPWPEPLPLIPMGSFGAYLNRVGLGIALYTAVDTGLFFAVYGFVRWSGKRYFDWGRQGKIGNVTYYSLLDRDANSHTGDVERS